MNIVYRIPNRMIPLFIVLLLLGAMCQSVFAQPVDNTIYARLLKEYVNQGRVDYAGLKADEAQLDHYLDILSRIDPDTLSRNHQFAFYINAYNAATLKLILTRYPDINSIKEAGSFFSSPWGKKFIQLNRRKVSLDYIEHQVLRPKFKDPRVHFAINCAARGCPPLLNTPYEGDRIETQLTAQTHAFVNTTRTIFIRDNTLYISKIFKWFEEDFNDNPLGFIRQYADPPLANALDAAGADLDIEFLPYSWALNRL